MLLYKEIPGLKLHWKAGIFEFGKHYSWGSLIETSLILWPEITPLSRPICHQQLGIKITTKPGNPLENKFR